MKTENELAGQARQWFPAVEKEPRSIFGNFRPGKSNDAGEESVATHEQAVGRGAMHGEGRLQPAIDVALARCFIYRCLAQAFEYPSDAGWKSLTSAEGLANYELCIGLLAEE